MRFLFAFIFMFAACCTAALAQPAKVQVEDVRSTEKLVKGAPFTATAVTESIQTLADGTRISRSSTSKLYRDSQGRYRRDDNRKQLGVPGAEIEVPESILILDPVIATRYTLNPRNRTFRRTGFKSTFGFDLKQGREKIQKLSAGFEGKGFDVAKKLAEQEPKLLEAAAELSAVKAKIESGSIADEGEPLAKAAPAGSAGKGGFETRIETLGSRTIEGVAAEGSRATTVIPIGAIGNDREINIVYEKWYSNDLKMTLHSILSDPRIGEQTYRLTDINRAEPQATVFSVPADYNEAVVKRVQQTDRKRGRSSDTRDRDLKSPPAPGKPVQPPGVKIVPPVPPAKSKSP